MVKLIYTGPNDFNIRIGRSVKVFSFNKANNRTLDVDRDDLYKLIREPRQGEYLKIEGDPKAVVKGGYKSPGISMLGQHTPSGESTKTVIESEGKKTQVVDTDVLTDEILELDEGDIDIEGLEGKEPNRIVAEVETQVNPKSLLT